MDTEKLKATEWYSRGAVEGNKQDECLLAVSHLVSHHPAPLHSSYRGETFSLCFTSCQAVVELPVVLFASQSQRGTPLLFFLFIEF